MQLVDRVIGGWSSNVDHRRSSLVAPLSQGRRRHISQPCPRESKLFEGFFRQAEIGTVAPANVKLERRRYLLRRWLDNDNGGGTIICFVCVCVVSSECAHVEVGGCTRGSINGGKLAVLGDALSPTSCFVSHRLGASR